MASRAMLLASLGSVAAGLSVTPVALLSFDAEGAKARPVAKVITLLKDMLKQMEKEGDEDEDVYDKMACWCETNDKEKTKAVADAGARITDLSTNVEEFTAAGARLGTELKQLQGELNENTKALDSATAIRQKQLAEFNGEEKDLLQSISALKAATTILGKHHSNMLQVPLSHLNMVATTLQHELIKHSQLLEGILTSSDRRTIGMFVQSPEDYFDAQTPIQGLLQAPGKSYSPQSGEIFGILRQMKDTFQSNLASSQADEKTNQKAYEDLKAAKEAQIAAGQSQVDTKTQQLADTNEKNAQAKEDMQDTKSSLAADQKFLSMLKEKCTMNDGEWEQRQKTRQNEMEAVSKTLSLLSSDDAHDLFTKTFNPSFLQTDSSAVSSIRDQASKILASHPRLATLAERLQLDTFGRVKKAISRMVAQLLKEKSDEIKHKDFCVDEFNKNAQQTEEKIRDKQDVRGKIDDLELQAKTIGENMAAIQAEVKELNIQVKRAGVERKKQSKDFQMTVADQRATQRLLVQAGNVLKSFYSKKAAFVQASPAGFQSYKPNAAAGGVLGLLQQIVADAKAMEAEALHDEADAEKSYRKFVKSTRASIDQKNKDMVHKAKNKAKAEKDLVESRNDKSSVMTEMEQLANYNAQLHSSCDFITKNFAIRQTARDEEVEALKQAKAILSGASFTEF